MVRLESYSGARTAAVVGVLEPSVPYPVATEIIANVVTSPHHLSATMVQGREHRMTEVFARLAPGATLEQARAELNTVYSAMTQAHPEVYKPEDHFTIGVTRMHDQINSRANTILWVLFAASGLLFVIASSNVANLVLARTVRREPELAIRSALGASTAVLRRSLLAESLVLCGSGTVAAVLLAVPMVKVLGHYAQRFTVRAADLTLDFSLLWFGAALAIVAAVFLAYIPRLPSPDAPAEQPDRPRRARDRLEQPQAAHLCHHADCRVVPAAHRRLRADEDALRAGADAAAVRLGQCAGRELAGDELRQDRRAGERVLSRSEGARERAARRGARGRRIQRAVARRTGPEHQPSICGAGRAPARRQRRIPRTVPPGFAGILCHHGRADS